MTEKEFEQKWVDKLRKERKTFPEDFASFDSFEELSLHNKKLIMGSEFFGAYEITDTDGNLVAAVKEYGEAKYYLYASISKPEKIKVPPLNEMRAAVKIYENYLDSILREIEVSFKAAFPNSRKYSSSASRIFHSANLTRY